MVRKKWKKREIIIGLSFILTVIAVLTFYIWHQARLFHLGIENGHLQSQVKSLQKDVESLEAKKSYLLRLERVEKKALLELKLAPPKEDQILLWRELNEQRQQEQ